MFPKLRIMRVEKWPLDIVRGKEMVLFYYVLSPLTLAYQVLNDSLILLSTFLIFYLVDYANCLIYILLFNFTINFMK